MQSAAADDERPPVGRVGLDELVAQSQRLQRFTPQGTVVMKLSALCSTWNPSSWTVASTPPSRGPASSSVTAALRIEFHQPMRSRQAGDSAADYGDASDGGSVVVHAAIVTARSAGRQWMKIDFAESDSFSPP